MVTSDRDSVERSATESAVAVQVEAVVELYAAAFAEPPYCEGPEHVQRFREKFAADIARPGFAFVGVVDAGRLLGMAFGWTLPAGRWWNSALAPPPAYLLDVDKFAVMELAVDPGRRGEGIGRGLLGRLLADRVEPYATLCANPAAAAHRMYQRWGWESAGTTEPKSLFPAQEIFVQPIG